MISVSVLIKGAGGATPPLVVQVDSTDKRPNAAVCQIKRAVEKAVGLAPFAQRLYPEGKVDGFAVPSAVRVEEREKRQPRWELRIESTHPGNPEVVDLLVDANDSILDLKFLVSRAVKVPAECVHLYARPAGVNHLVELPDEQTVSTHTLPFLKSIKVMYQFPSGVKGHGAVHRTVSRVRGIADASAPNLCANFRLAAKRYPGRKFLGHRNKAVRGAPYVWQTYGEIAPRVTHVASGLRQLGLGRGARVGIMSPNRPEWTIVDLACSSQSFVSVPLYDTLGPDAVEFILNHAEVRVVIVAPEMLAQIASVRARCPTVENVIVLPEVVDWEEERAKKRAAKKNSSRKKKGKRAGEAEEEKKVAPGGNVGGRVLQFADVEKMGAERPMADEPPRSPNELSTICYTSGTTGKPKGAMLTHGNLVTAVMGLRERIPVELIDEEEIILSYLPLAHIYERVLQAMSVSMGFGIGFFGGDTQKLVEDVAELRPTVFPGVPRVWQKVHDRIKGQADASNAVRRFLFQRALASKESALDAGNGKESLWDTLVFSKVADRFGGRVKLLTSGAAPLSTAVARFMKISLGCHFGEGYGLTETCAALTTTDYEDYQYGHVGTPLGVCEVKLVDVEAMEYLSTDKPCPRGEVWVRGPAVFQGYYKAPEKTAEVLTRDGWFCTGDIGKWRADGNLQIIDRKKNIFKLSQGEYIRPEYIEGVYKQSRFVAQVFVHGESTENWLVAVVVPDFETVRAWPQLPAELAKAGTTDAQIAAHPRVRKAIEQDMRAVGVQEKLRGFEHAKRVHVIGEEFSVDNGLLTPTFKLKRHVCKQRFREEIGDMYAEIKKAIADGPAVRSKL